MGLFDWLFGSKAAKEIAETVKDTAVEVGKDAVEDAVSAFLDAEIEKAVSRMRRTIKQQYKLSISGKKSLNARLESILQAIEGARGA